MKPFKILLLLILLGFSQCGSLNFLNHPPFEILSSTVYNNPEKSETKIYIRYNDINSKRFFGFDSLFFQKKKLRVDIKTINGLNYIYANFTKLNKKEFTLDSNSINEINNPIPEINKFPFKLNENEAVLSYKVKGKIKYFKIKSIVKENSINIK